MPTENWGHLCEACWGTGDRDPFCGAPCFYCDGTGWIEDGDPEDDDETYADHEDEDQ